MSRLKPAPTYKRRTLRGAERAVVEQPPGRARQELAESEIVFREDRRHARHLQRLHAAVGFSGCRRLRIEHLGSAAGTTGTVTVRGPAMRRDRATGDPSGVPTSPERQGPTRKGRSNRASQTLSSVCASDQGETEPDEPGPRHEAQNNQAPGQRPLSHKLSQDERSSHQVRQLSERLTQRDSLLWLAVARIVSSSSPGRRESEGRADAEHSEIPHRDV